MKFLSQKSFILSIVCILCMAMLFSCENDPNEVKKVNPNKDQPDEWGENITIFYSEDAKAKIKLTAPQMEKFYKEEIITIMPKGILVLFYDSLQNPKSKLKAGYAIDHQLKRIVEAKYNIVIVNEFNDTLNTEYLIWDRKTKKIYTNEYVKIITHNNEVIHGRNGMVADEKFTKWRINKVRNSTLYIPPEQE